jgi:hypothetical protein
MSELLWEFARQEAAAANDEAVAAGLPADILKLARRAEWAVSSIRPSERDTWIFHSFGNGAPVAEFTEAELRTVLAEAVQLLRPYGVIPMNDAVAYEARLALGQARRDFLAAHPMLDQPTR